MTFAQFHYPFENKEFFEKNFPAQFVAEYLGQVRAWFYYMNVLSAILFKDIPFENIVTTGTVLAENGEKMSKSKGNFFILNDLLERGFSPKAVRYVLFGAQYRTPMNLAFDGLRDAENTLNKLLEFMERLDEIKSGENNKEIKKLIGILNF